MSDAWIGLTHPEWHAHFERHPATFVDFWRPSDKRFSAIVPGGRFFCLRRGSPAARRELVAMGVFRRYESRTLREAWNLYGAGMGAPSWDDLRRFDLASDAPIVHILLDGFRIAESRISIGMFSSETGVDFAGSIQTGKGISQEAADWLEYAMFGGASERKSALGPLVDKVIGTDEPGRKEVVREIVLRNPRVVEEAKRRQGTRCRVCDFDFGETYGELGEGFVEAHHWPMLSEGGSDTPDSIVMVCANCHRMLHRHAEGLDWRQLRDLIATRPMRTRQ